MKSRHNTRQDQPIVNATDNTSALFAAARMLAPPVCAAADSPIANSGRGMMNARRSSRGRWRSMAVLIAVAAMLAVCISPALASALTCDCDICVNTSGWWSDGGVFNANATMPIQAAIDGVTAGETIYVWNGSYTENVDVNKQLTLAGEGAGVVTVTNSTADHHVFNVTADYVNISGFNVTGATGDATAGIYLGSGVDHCNISNNTASNNICGIYLDSSSNNTLLNNNAAGNFGGIGIGSSSNNTLTNNTASGNLYGIGIWSSSNNTLTNNTANSNDFAGIYLESSSNNTLSSNTANSNDFTAGAGIYLDSSSNNNTLTSNTASNNNCGICLGYSSNNMLSNNTASNNNFGIFLGSSSNNTLSNNAAGLNAYYGIYLRVSSNNNTLTNNTASNNVWDIYIEDSSSIFEDNTLNGTTVSFTYCGNVSLKGVGSPAADPSGQNSIGKFINATNQSAGAWLYLNFSYSDSDMSGLDESSLAVWKYNGTVWLEDNWNGTRYLNTTNNLVGANITTFSVFVPMAPATGTTPPDPTTLANTTGNFWVNHTWSAGSGNITDSYNVSVNGVWYNTTTDTFYNDTYTAHAWQNITVYAWNTSGTGTLSAGSISQNTQIPNNPVTITNTTDWSGDAENNVYVDYDATDADSDTPTFSCNRTDLFTDFSTATGQGNWTAAAGTYYVDFGVSDGWGSTSNYTMTITASAPPEYIPPDPTTLANTTGDFWVNHTWSAGSGNVTDSYNVHVNGVWYNTTTDTFYNDTYTAQAWQNITVYAFNSSGTGTLSAGCVSGEVQVPSEPTFPCTCGDICVNTSGWWRGGGGAFNGSGTPIQAAVDAASSGETICVGAGSYTENVNVDKHLTLAGEGADVVTVTAASDHVFEVTVDYVNISGFNLTGATNADYGGIYLYSAEHCNISDNIASGNDYGIYLHSSSNYNTLTGNTASNNYRGIYLDSSSNNTLTGNNVSNNSDGICLWSSSYNTLLNNNADSNNDYGIGLSSSSYNTLLNNNADSNNGAGIYLGDSSYNTLLNNNADSNDFTGIFLIFSSYNTLTSNNADSNTDYGIYLDSSSNNLISNNYFSNTQNAYDDGNNIWNTTPTVGTNIIGGSWLGGNYWSDYAGNDTTGDGLGDTLTPYNSSADISNGGDHHPLIMSGSVTPTPPGGSSGGDGTYPPGWFTTPTPAVTATATPAATGTATDAPPGDKVTPVATKKPAAAKATAPAAEGTTAGKAKKGAPGFTAVSVIAGMLAVTYAMMRRRE